MSATKVLEEIDARLKAAHPAADWHPEVSRGERRYHHTGEFAGRLMWRALGPLCEEGDERLMADAALMCCAPADLALLSRLVREVAEADCDYAADTIPAVCASRGDPCWPCRIRRGLEDGR